MTEVMKPDQERVKNLLTDTVTLLCKNGLTFSDQLRIEGLLGVSIDNNDVFFVHISEKFAQNPPEPVCDNTPQTESTSQEGSNQESPSPVFTAPASPAPGSKRTPCQSPSRQQRASPSSSPARVKHEPAEEADDLLIVEEPKPEVLEKAARQAAMVAGQRRAQRRERSPSQHQGGWEDMGEPPTKRHFALEDQSENGSGYTPGAEDTSWPNIGSADQFNPQMYQQDPGGATFDTTSPGCSSWPSTVPSHSQVQDSMGLTDRSFARNPAPMISMTGVRTALTEHIVHPVKARRDKVLAFRMAWTTKNIQENLIWEQLFHQSRDAFELDLKSSGGIAFFISAVTATVSNQTNRRDVCPALGCFVVPEDSSFKEAPLYIRLRNNPFGGTLKLMNDRGVRAGEDRYLVWLSLLLKDNVQSGYVLGKMATAGMGTANPSVVRIFVHSDAYKEVLLQAKRALDAEGFPVYLEYF